MNEEQRAAFLNSQTACAMIEAMGMVADNQMRALAKEPPAFTKGAFDALTDQYGIGHNAAVTWLHGQ